MTRITLTPGSSFRSLVAVIAVAPQVRYYGVSRGLWSLSVTPHPPNMAPSPHPTKTSKEGLHNEMGVD